MRKTFQGRIFAGLIWCFARLSLRSNHALGRLFGWIAMRIPNRSQRVARRNLALCFVDKSDAERETLLAQMLKQTGCNLTELGLIWNHPTEQVLSMIRKIDQPELLADAVALGKGVLLASPHLGAWELLSPYLSTQFDTSVLYREPKDPGIDAVIQRGRSRQGARLIEAGPAGIRTLYRDLKQGRLIAILPDQQPKRGQGEFAPFFGMQALTMTLFSKLAIKSDAVPILAWMERLPDGEGYHLHLRAFPDLVSNGTMNESIAAVNEAVENEVRRCPAQYQWGYKRFSIRPEGEPPLYQDLH